MPYADIEGVAQVWKFSCLIARQRRLTHLRGETNTTITHLPRLRQRHTQPTLQQ